MGGGQGYERTAGAGYERTAGAGYERGEGMRGGAYFFEFVLCHESLDYLIVHWLSGLALLSIAPCMMFAPV